MSVERRSTTVADGALVPRLKPDEQALLRCFQPSDLEPRPLKPSLDLLPGDDHLTIRGLEALGLIEDCGEAGWRRTPDGERILYPDIELHEQQSLEGWGA